jgi:hypothetical protein
LKGVERGPEKTLSPQALRPPGPIGASDGASCKRIRSRPNRDAWASTRDVMTKEADGLWYATTERCGTVHTSSDLMMPIGRPRFGGQGTPKRALSTLDAVISSSIDSAWRDPYPFRGS